jgi:hypothetical protein
MDNPEIPRLLKLPQVAEILQISENPGIPTGRDWRVTQRSVWGANGAR